jgi:ABC-type glycerol-3-phosphate transport system substrate-binding protein
MPAVYLSRRTCLTLAVTGAVGLLAACGGAATLTTTGTTAAALSVTSAAVTSAASSPASSAAVTSASTLSAASAAATTTAAATVATASSAASTTTAAAAVAATPSPVPVVIKPGMTPVRLLVHWDGQSLDALQKQVIDPYNNGAGGQSKIQVVVEHVPDAQESEKIVAGKLGGDPQDIYHSSNSVKVLAEQQLANPLSVNEQTYVKQNYYPGAGARLTHQGKVYGYPTEFQPMGYFYRKSFYQQMGLTTPPKTTDDEFDYAQKLTQKQGNATTRVGFTIMQGRLGQNLASWIARFGGQMYTFDGDHPTKIDVASSQAIDALTYLKKLVDAGVTEGTTSYTTAWQNSQAASAEIEVWFPLDSILQPGKKDVFNDLGAATVPPAPGIQPIWFFYGYGLIPANGAKHPDEAALAMEALMHQPAMPWSRFIVETIGSPPAPLNYPQPIPNWTPELIQAYAVDAVKTALPRPQENVLGISQLSPVYTKTINDILANKTSVQSGLEALNPQLNDILKRTDP